MRSRPRHFGLVALLFCGAASAGSIPLAPGDYGAVGQSCDMQPNATIVGFDGRHFSYPHATACRDRVVGRSAGVLAIAETCGALGDGTRAVPTTERFRIRVDAPDRFRAWHGRHAQAFRRCGPPGALGRR